MNRLILYLLFLFFSAASIAQVSVSGNNLNISRRQLQRIRELKELSYVRHAPLTKARTWPSLSQNEFTRLQQPEGSPSLLFQGNQTGKVVTRLIAFFFYSSIETRDHAKN